MKIEWAWKQFKELTLIPNRGKACFTLVWDKRSHYENTYLVIEKSKKDNIRTWVLNEKHINNTKNDKEDVRIFLDDLNWIGLSSFTCNYDLDYS